MINYDRRRFRSADADPDGQAPVAEYRQDGNVIWAEFAGGEVRRGTLVGTCGPDGTLDFAYSQVNHDGSVVSGFSHAVPEELPDGRIRLHETWERYGANGRRGTGMLEEVAAGAA
jgi:hypothetical protein